MRLIGLTAFAVVAAANGFPLEPSTASAETWRPIYADVCVDLDSINVVGNSTTWVGRLPVQRGSRQNANANDD
jgi:hypothetical protein